MNIKLIATDIDGVWTDGGMYYDNEGNELKKFHTYDSAGVLLARKLNIPVCIITGESTEIVRRRAEKLNIEHLYQGISDKVKVLTGLCDELNISPKEVAYIGDDLNDAGVLAMVGYSATPANAPLYIQKYADKVLKLKGGEGAFREFVEGLLEENGLLDSTVQKVLEG